MLYIDAASALHYDKAANFALTCPHCQVLAHLTPVSVPAFGQLVAFKPSHVGVVYRCDSCNSPVFLKYPVKIYSTNRIELATDFSELERAPEQFNFTYLPEEPELLFREALVCFEADALWPLHPLGVFADLERPADDGESKDVNDPAEWRRQVRNNLQTLLEYRANWHGTDEVFQDADSIFRSAEGHRLYREWAGLWWL